MGKYIQGDAPQSKNIQSVEVSKQMRAEVLKKVSIPLYFSEIIVPQLGDYYSLYPVDFDNKPTVCCPLHDEDTPSCRYYEETNSFYCFGCQRGGSVIELHSYYAEKNNGTLPTKDEAIAFLHNYFVKGKETSEFIEYHSLIDKPLSTDAEIVKFNIYRLNLEKSISFDRDLKKEIKLELWELLDNLDCLLSKNLVSAKDAEKKLRDEVKRLITPENYNNKIKPKGRT